MAKTKAASKSQPKAKDKVEIEKIQDQIVPELEKVEEPKKRAQKKEKIVSSKTIDKEQNEEPQKSKAVVSKKKAAKLTEKQNDEKIDEEEPQQTKAAPKRRAAQKKVIENDEDNDEEAEEPKTSKTKKTTTKKPAKQEELENNEQNSDEVESPKEKKTAAKSTKTKAEKKPAQKKVTKTTENNEGKEEQLDQQKAKTAPKRKAVQKKASENDEKDQLDEVQSPKKAKVTATKKNTKAAKKEPENDEEISDEIVSPKKKTAKQVNGSAEKKKLLNSTESDYNIDFNIKKDFATKIVTWNVAGARSCLQKGLVEYLRRENADIICLNEVKIGSEKEIPKELKIPEYYHYFNIGKGNPGVAIFTKKKPIKVTNDLPEIFTNDNRLITAEYEDFYLVSCYVVNAGQGLKTLDKRLEWNRVFDKYIQELDKEKPVIIAGDLNVSHNEIDLANPKSNQRSAGFTKEERDGFTKLLSYGFIDTFRELYPKQEGAYTFWSYRFNARAKNTGWRLDYFVVSERFMENVVDNVIRTNILGSDHCPLVLFLN
ncbi:hypothetical protein PVAND_012201 [Polypedilum vanderplanki]|uniref:DNA-(apurinic or apyrimidinic site) endonuclease n=1 Tax=Polypedilum vanderplanki TaxID=319348 RepID=A0A9J6CMN3_POLVA|nr:hypothetical protein PVAND_012201 [Polypedilum vanderplanki]